MTTPKRFASWAAVSSLPQAKKVSLEDQLAVNRQHAERWGGVIVEELVVPGESRDIVLFEDAARKLPAYARLYELIQARAFDVLIFLDRSRLGRQAVLSMAVVALCRKQGIAVYEVESPPASLEEAARQTHSDMLIGAIKSVDAENEISKLRERHRKGMIGRIKAGQPASKLAWGYRWEYDDKGGRSIVIDEPAAAVVRELFDLYLAGHGTPYIARLFTGRGQPTPEGRARWQPVNVRSILDNVRRYAGINAVNRRSRTQPPRPYTEAAGAWPAIIDAATLARIEAERQYRATNRRRVDTPYLLSGVVCCRHCGRRLIVRRFRPAQPHHLGGFQLVCPEHGGIAYRRVEAKLREKLAALNAVDINTLADFGELDAGAILRERIARLEAQLRDLDAALTRADSSYVRGTMTVERYEAQVGRINGEIFAVRGEIEAVRHELAQESERGSRSHRLAETAVLGLAKLDDPDQAAANSWLRAHVRVWVDRRTVFAVEWI